MQSKRLIAKASSAPPPWITRARANFVPIAEIVEQDNITRDNTNAVEKKSKNDNDEKTVVETKSDDEDDEDDNDGSTPNAKSGSKPTCD